MIILKITLTILLFNPTLHISMITCRLSLPGKLVFPSTQNTGHFSMLGLGDIVMPGLLLCFVMRYDAYKRAQVCSLEIEDNNANKTKIRELLNLIRN